MKQNILLEVTMRLVPVPNMILLFLFTHQYSTVHLPLVHVWPVRLHLLGSWYFIFRTCL